MTIMIIINKQINKQSNNQTIKQSNKQSNNHTNKQTNKQTNKRVLDGACLYIDDIGSPSRTDTVRASSILNTRYLRLTL